MSNFAIYLVGFLIVIGGLAWAAVSLGAPPMWIGIGAVILLGLGVVSGVSKTRIRESSSGDASAKRVTKAPTRTNAAALAKLSAICHRTPCSLMQRSPKTSRVFATRT